MTLIIFVYHLAKSWSVNWRSVVFGLNAVYFGDELKITGKLRTMLGASQGQLSFAQIVLVRHQSSLIGDIRRRFATGSQNALLELLNGFTLGLLVGQQDSVGQSFETVVDYTFARFKHCFSVDYRL